MTVPLVFLGALSVLGGLVNTPLRLTLEHFLEPAFEAVTLAHAPHGSAAVLLAAISVAAGIVGIGLAAMRYRSRVPAEEAGLWRLAGRGYYVDDLYAQVFARTGKLGAAWLAFRFDTRVVDGTVEGVGGLTRRIGAWLRPIQTGFVRSYAVIMLAGMVALLAWFLSRGAL
jgi:NADH-quinone oxidoreductase subunit L